MRPRLDALHTRGHLWTEFSASCATAARPRRSHLLRRPAAASLLPSNSIPFTCVNDASPPQSPECAAPPPPPCPDCWSFWGWPEVERARRHGAFFRLVVVGGRARAYVETYRRAFQTRDVFTQWVGRAPDAAAARVPVLQEDGSTLDVAFPDWSSWGRPEVNIGPWAKVLEEAAVDYGNKHLAQARLVGEQGSRFVREEISMDYVYDYMLHLLTEYAKLLRYKPTVPENAVEICTEPLACPANATACTVTAMMQSMEKHVAGFQPCTLPLPFIAEEAKEIAQREADVLWNKEKMESELAS
ncbi:hypothetical protein QOZ80_6BG0461350 [Eleusine coracana subsp. coracana]|nr:hypothetical protein QOZ80_6BG0461350 [Eleusine coracana subsp. coracana]